jgi:hypothetical protein
LRGDLDGVATGAGGWIRVPWRTVTVATATAIAVPAVIVAGSVLLNPTVRLRAVADDHLRAGRLGEAAVTYRTVVARAPRWARAWDRLGVVSHVVPSLCRSNSHICDRHRPSSRQRGHATATRRRHWVASIPS